jgi:hypothetical protein
LPDNLRLENELHVSIGKVVRLALAFKGAPMVISDGPVEG